MSEASLILVCLRVQTEIYYRWSRYSQFIYKVIHNSVGVEKGPKLLDSYC
ncbi:hypothetical protein CULT_2390004 [[Clostridium] ultunense Esp]|nr:hypothetical protein CULT_2390004 [[Clostridium] ultunense Esp]